MLPRALIRAWLAFLFCSPPAWATGAGTTAADFLKLPVGARPTALGGAFTGLSDDANGLGYNPAGLAFLKRSEITMMHDAMAAGVHHEWLALGHPTSLGSFGFSASAVLVDAFPAYDEFDRRTDNTSAQDGAYGAAYAVKPLDFLALGVNLKSVHSRLAGYTARTYAFDAGAIIEPAPGLRLGASVLNAGPGLRFISESYPLPLTTRAGASYALGPKEVERHRALVTADFVATRGEAPYAAGGLELWYKNALALRGGGRSGQTAGLGYTVGIGLYTRLGGENSPELGFDYALVDMGELTRSHRGSITFRFGGGPRAVERPRRQSAAPKPRPAPTAPPARTHYLEPTPSETVRPKDAPAQPEPQNFMWIKP